MSLERSSQHMPDRPLSRFDRVVSTIASRTETLRETLVEELARAASADFAPSDIQPLIDAKEKLRGVMLEAPYTNELYLIDPTLRLLARANDPELAQFLSHTYAVTSAAELIQHGAAKQMVDQAAAEHSHKLRLTHAIDQQWLKPTTPSTVIDEIVRQQAAGRVHLLGVGAALYGANRQMLLMAEDGAEGVPVWRFPAQKTAALFDRASPSDIESQITPPPSGQLRKITLTVGPNRPPVAPGVVDVGQPAPNNVPVWQIETGRDEILPVVSTLVVSGENTAQVLRSELSAHMDILVIGHEGLQGALKAQAEAWQTITEPTFRARYGVHSIETTLPKLAGCMDHMDVRTAQIMYAAMREEGEGLGVEVYDVEGLTALRGKISICTAWVS